MTNEQTILSFASAHGGRLARKEFFAWLQAQYSGVSIASFDVVLRNMVSKGRLIKEGRGEMSVPQSLKKDYIPKISDDIRALQSKLQEEYPYTKLCIWSVSAISPFVQHIPYSNTIIVEVEKQAVEAVFHSIKAISDRTALLNPTQKVYDLYSTHTGNIIVKSLVSESPTISINGVTTPSLEKILVDISIDSGFSFATDAELYTIYENAFEMYDVNTKTMLRYASRRGRKDEIQKLIDSVI